jgi:hypothetical protein
MDIDPERIAKSPFLIGLLGGIVALRGVPGASWRDRTFNALSASLLAGFLSPAVAEYFGMTSASMQGATAFLVGLFGLNVTATAVEWIRNATLDDVLPWRKKG